MRLLVIAAHVDDEALLCGGTLHKAARRGHESTVAFCTKNEEGRWAEERVESRRQRAETEAETSSALLGFQSCFLGFNDMSLGDSPGLLQKEIIQLVRQIRPDVVITHSADDWHSDHRCLGALVPEAALQSGSRVAGGTTIWRPSAVLHGEVDLEGLTAFRFHVVSHLDPADLGAKTKAVEAYNSITTDHATNMASLRRSLEARASIRGARISSAAGEAFGLSSLLPLDAAALRTVAELVA